MKDNEDSLLEGITVDCSEGNEDSLAEEVLNVNGSEENEDSLVEGTNVDRYDVTKSVNIDVAESVGEAVYPWQLPLLIETSSIAMSLL